MLLTCLTSNLNGKLILSPPPPHFKFQISYRRQFKRIVNSSVCFGRLQEFDHKDIFMQLAYYGTAVSKPKKEQVYMH